MRLTTTLGLLISVGLSSGCTLRAAAPHHGGYAATPQPIPQGNLPPTTATCAQVEVAPGVFRSTDCEQRPAMRTSAFVRRFQLPLRQTSKGLQPISKAELPIETDLSFAEFAGPVRDQGAAGVCWSMAMSAVADNALRLKGYRRDVSPLHLIAHRAYDELHDRVRTSGVTQETAWSYDQVRACKLDRADHDYCQKYIGVKEGTWRNDPQLTREVQAADANAYYSFGGAEYFDTTDQIAWALAQSRVVYVGMRIDTEVWK